MAKPEIKQEDEKPQVVIDVQEVVIPSRRKFLEKREDETPEQHLDRIRSNRPKRQTAVTSEGESGGEGVARQEGTGLVGIQFDLNEDISPLDRLLDPEVRENINEAARERTEGLVTVATARSTWLQLSLGQKHQADALQILIGQKLLVPGESFGNYLASLVGLNSALEFRRDLSLYEKALKIFIERFLSPNAALPATISNMVENQILVQKVELSARLEQARDAVETTLQPLRVAALDRENELRTKEETLKIDLAAEVAKKKKENEGTLIKGKQSDVVVAAAGRDAGVEAWFKTIAAALGGTVSLPLQALKQFGKSFENIFIEEKDGEIKIISNISKVLGSGFFIAGLAVSPWLLVAGTGSVLGGYFLQEFIDKRKKIEADNDALMANAFDGEEGPIEEIKESEKPQEPQEPEEEKKS